MISSTALRFPAKRRHRERGISPEFGRLLIQAREEIAVSRQTIADSCEVSYSTIYRHETGRATHLPTPNLFWDMVFAYQLEGAEVRMFRAAYGG